MTYTILGNWIDKSSDPDLSGRDISAANLEHIEQGVYDASVAASSAGFTTTSASFTQPGSGSTVSVTVGTTAWMAVGENLFVENGGYYSVSSITNSTHVVLKNSGYPGNAALGAIIASGSKVSPGGIQGAPGSGGVAPVDTVSNLEGITGIADGDLRYLEGYYAAEDGGGGMVRRNATSGATRDGVGIFTSADGGRFERVEQQNLRIECAGVAQSQSAATNRTRLSAALEASSRRYVLSAGDYAFDNSSILTVNTWEGELIFAPKARLVPNTSNVGVLSFVGGTGARFIGMNLTYSTLPTTRTGGEGVAVGITTDTYFENYRINGSSQVGLIFNSCIRPKVNGAFIQNTMADGLHFANCQDPQAINIVTDTTGDDGLAFVNYAADAANTGGQATNIIIRHSNTRGIAVVGQSNVEVNNFYVEDTTMFGIYCAYEASFSTRVPDKVKFSNGTVVSGGDRTATKQAGVVYVEPTTVEFNNVTSIAPGTIGFSGSGAASTAILKGCRAYNTPGDGFNLFGQIICAENLVAQETNDYGIYINGATLVEFDDLTAINSAKTSSLHRAITFESNTNVIGNGIKIVDLQTTPTGYVLGTYGTQRGTIGDVSAVIPNGALSIDNQSGLLLGTFLGASDFAAHQTSSQTLTASAFTKILYQTEDYDFGSEYDPSTSRFTANQAGTYLVSGGVMVSSMTDGTRLVISALKNGSEDMRLFDFTPGAASDAIASGSGLMRLSAGDYVELWAFCTAADSTTTAGALSKFKMTLVKS